MVNKDGEKHRNFTGDVVKLKDFDRRNMLDFAIIFPLKPICESSWHLSDFQLTQSRHKLHPLRDPPQIRAIGNVKTSELWQCTCFNMYLLQKQVLKLQNLKLREPTSRNFWLFSNIGKCF